MPNYNRAFSNSNKNNVSANDYINKVKAKTIFEVVSTNITDCETNSNVPVKTIPCSCDGKYKTLQSIGGLDVNSYQLLLDLTKGRYYTAKNGRYATIESDTKDKAVIKINDCSNIIIQQDKNNEAPITRNLGILENNFLVNTSDTSSCNCINEFNTKNNKILDSIIDISSNGRTELAYYIDNEPLRGIVYPAKFSILNTKL